LCTDEITTITNAQINYQMHSNTFDIGSYFISTEACQFLWATNNYLYGNTKTYEANINKTGFGGNIIVTVSRQTYDKTVDWRPLRGKRGPERRRIYS